MCAGVRVCGREGGKVMVGERRWERVTKTEEKSSTAGRPPLIQCVFVCACARARRTGGRMAR